MKKKIVYGTFVLLMAVIVSMNMHISLNVDDGLANLSFANVEQIAVAEDHQSNSGWEWWTQGARKDERELSRPCPTVQITTGNGNASYGGVIVGGGGTTTQINPAGRNDISCPFGYDNCTSIGC